MENPDVDLLIIAAAAAFVIDRAKRSRWFPWVNEHTKHYVAVLVALATSLGIDWQYDAAQGILQISGLQVSGLYHLTVESVRTYVLQQGAAGILTLRQRERRATDLKTLAQGKPEKEAEEFEEV